LIQIFLICFHVVLNKTYICNQMKSRAVLNLVKRSLGTLVGTLAGLAASAAFAVGTPAGTAITNSATLTFSIGGQAAPAVTAIAAGVAVAEVINVLLTSQDGNPLAVSSPDSGRALTFLLTNTGNGKEAFGLTRNNLITGDQFDPVSAAGAIYLESGAQPGFQATGPNADIAYVPGSNDPVLLADGSRAIYVVSNIPAAQPTGAVGNASLSAASTTAGAAGAAPGTTLLARGDAGIDAVVGGSRAQAKAQGGYIVSGLVLNVLKTVAAVSDPQGGVLVMPGSVLSYRIVLTLSGTGIAENLSFSDPLPASTTYLAGSLTVDGAARSDAVDSDNASVVAGAVAVLFGSTTAPATRVIEFKAGVN
jgi:uncharacterized repeat protein (TIGR01451 family)